MFVSLGRTEIALIVQSQNDRRSGAINQVSSGPGSGTFFSASSSAPAAAEAPSSLAA
eukprot:COSAG06_NODE_11491_length_1502_cov_2.383464_3_plen_56_part_01